jgi:prolipoprotein diacylglyceryltransferase
MSYGIIRFCEEYFREPDSQIGYVSGLTLNQIFAMILIFLGIFLIAVKFTTFGRFLQEKSGRWIVYPVGIYGVVRFGLDFLRATDLPSADPRYFGLTPAQFT